MRGWISAVIACLAIACGSSSESSDTFDPVRVMDIEITMAPQDWDSIRSQGRDASALAGDCQSGPPEKIYDFRRAEVTIDGTPVGEVGVRKKGFLGSISVVRPSLKISFDRIVPGQRYQGRERMTLNNNRQDPSQIRTCMVYGVFRDAGLPAPRCNFARVTVNGEDLGVYSHVEPIKKAFLRQSFSADSGSLYEGQLSDFRAGWSANFESKTDATSVDQSDLAALVDALERPDDELLEAVSQHLDYEQFLSFWVLENLVGHWDGYSNNLNNFYIYADPEDGKFRFIPWGPDIGFTSADPFSPGDRPASVSATGHLPARLYALPGVRSDYVARMQQMLDTVWNESELLAEVDRIDALLDGAADASQIAQIKSFIEGRREAIEAELAGGGAEWDYPQRNDPCWVTGSVIEGTFTAEYGTLDAQLPFSEGTASLTLSLGGEPVSFDNLGVVSGFDAQSSAPVVRYVGLSDGRIYVLQLGFEEPLFAGGETLPYHGFATSGILIEVTGEDNIQILGFLGSGAITLDQASPSPGAAISGSLTGTVYEPPAG